PTTVVDEKIAPPTISEQSSNIAEPDMPIQKERQPTPEAPKQAPKSTLKENVKAGNASRLSKNVLDSLHEINPTKTNQPLAELTQERVLEVFALYMEAVKNDGKNTYSAYLTQV